MIQLSTKKIYDQLAILIPDAYTTFEKHPEIKIIRFRVNADSEVSVEFNEDYLFPPNKEWQLLFICNKELLDLVFEQNDLELFIASKLLEWAARKIISKMFYNIEFEEPKGFDEEQFKELLKDGSTN
jgi:hypothetical protein